MSNIQEGKFHAGDLSHHRGPALLVPFNSASHPLNRFMHSSAQQCTDGKNPAVTHSPTFLAFKDLPDESLLYPDDFNTIFAILFVGQNENRYARYIRIL